MTISRQKKFSLYFPIAHCFFNFWKEASNIARTCILCLKQFLFNKGGGLYFIIVRREYLVIAIHSAYDIIILLVVWSL